MSKRRKSQRGDDPEARPGARLTAVSSVAEVAEIRQRLVRRQLRIRGRRPVLILTLVSMLLLTLSFEPFNLWPLAWLALTPWLIAIAASARWGWMLFCSWLGGFLFFTVNLYWLLACGYPGPWDGVLLMAGAVLALAAYQGLYFLLFAYVVGGLLRRWGPRVDEAIGRPRILLAWLVPVCWVAIEMFRGYVLSGFPWFLLAHSQARQSTLIQIADLGGAYAVSFLIAAVNGLLADGLLQPLFLRTPTGRRRNRPLVAAAAVVLALIVATGIYGRLRIGQVDLSQRPGPRIAVLQANFRVTLAPLNTPQEYADRNWERFDTHLALAVDAAKSQPAPDMVAWPETMVAGHINQEFLDIRWRLPAGISPDALAPMKTSAEMDARIRRLVADSSLPMLVGSVSIVPEPAGWPEGGGVGALLYYDSNQTGPPTQRNPQLVRYNSAILYQLPPGHRVPSTAPDALNAIQKSRYDKHHLVPFGEYLPFRRSWPEGFRLLRKLTPMELLNPGAGPRQLTLRTTDGRDLRFSPPICYEDVIAQAVRPSVYHGVPADDAKRADFLVNISNDGWFTGTTELKQHWAQAIFRCVENRVPMARSVNCGCSGFLDSLGRPIPLPGRPLGRLEPGEIGHLSAVLPLDDRVTVYSRIGDLPGWVCVALLLVGWATVIIQRRRGRRLAAEALRR